MTFDATPRFTADLPPRPTPSWGNWTAPSAAGSRSAAGSPAPSSSAAWAIHRHLLQGEGWAEIRQGSLGKSGFAHIIEPLNLTRIPAPPSTPPA